LHIILHSLKLLIRPVKGKICWIFVYLENLFMHQWGKCKAIFNRQNSWITILSNRLHLVSAMFIPIVLLNNFFWGQMGRNIAACNI